MKFALCRERQFKGPDKSLLQSRIMSATLSPATNAARKELGRKTLLYECLY